MKFLKDSDLFLVSDLTNKSYNIRVDQLKGDIGGSSVEISETPPDPDQHEEGTLWWDNSADDARLYILYNDPIQGLIWVDCSPPGGGGGSIPPSGPGITITITPSDPIIGEELKAVAVAKRGDPTYTYSDYQWYTADDRNGTNETLIAGQTTDTYTPVDSDVDKFIGCSAKSTDGDGNELTGIGYSLTSSKYPLVITKPDVLTPPDGSGMTPDTPYTPQTSNIDTEESITSTEQTLNLTNDQAYNGSTPKGLAKDILTAGTNVDKGVIKSWNTNSQVTITRSAGGYVGYETAAATDCKAFNAAYWLGEHNKNYENYIAFIGTSDSRNQLTIFLSDDYGETYTDLNFTVAGGIGTADYEISLLIHPSAPDILWYAPNDLNNINKIYYVNISELIDGSTKSFKYVSGISNPAGGTYYVDDMCVMNDKIYVIGRNGSSALGWILDPILKSISRVNMSDPMTKNIVTRQIIFANNKIHVVGSYYSKPEHYVSVNDGTDGKFTKISMNGTTSDFNPLSGCLNFIPSMGNKGMLISVGLGNKPVRYSLDDGATWGILQLSSGQNTYFRAKCNEIGDYIIGYLAVDNFEHFAIEKSKFTDSHPTLTFRNDAESVGSEQNKRAIYFYDSFVIPDKGAYFVGFPGSSPTLQSTTRFSPTGTNEGGKYKVGEPIISLSEFTPTAPDTDSIVFTSSVPNVDKGNVTDSEWGNAVWTITPVGGPASTETINIVPNQIQEFNPSSGYLSKDTQYTVTVKYDLDGSTTESADSKPNTFKTSSTFRTPFTGDNYYDSKTQDLITTDEFVVKYGVDPLNFNINVLGIYELTEQFNYDVQAYIPVQGKYKPIRDYTSEINSLLTRVTELEGN